MTPPPFLNRSRIPAGVFRNEALDHLDQLVEDLRRRRATAITIQNEARFRPPGMARALSQSYLYRCVEQAEAAASLCGQHSWLSAMTIARALLETIAAYRHQAHKLAGVVRTGDIQAIHDILHSASFATRLDGLRTIANDPAVQATNILTQVDALRDHRPSAREEYDFLSEFAHPNALGNFLFFGRHDRERDVVQFRPDGWIPDEALKWVGAAVFTIHAAIIAADEIEALAQELSRLGQRGPPE